MTGCKRIWEAEAARDGRLSREELAQFDRHAQSCSECAREQRLLRELANELGRRPTLDVDELSLRRRRQELLALANSERLATPSVRPRRVARLAAALLALFLACGGGFWLSHSLSPTEEPEVTLSAERGASYRRSIDEGVPTVALEAGRVSLSVRRGKARMGVRVRTPDAVITDVGTTFSVWVEHGRTQLVQVSEGSVVVRMHGKAPRLVNAGEELQPYEERVLPLPAAVAPVAAPSTREAVAPHVANEPRTKHAHAAKHLGERDKDAAAHSSEAERAFAAAVNTLKVGEAADAASLFWHFEQTHRDHALAEDASYLRVAALMRAGLNAEAHAAGRIYLERYPRGFRRPDVERMLNP